jgi:hypothetical protein
LSIDGVFLILPIVPTDGTDDDIETSQGVGEARRIRVVEFSASFNQGRCMTTSNRKMRVQSGAGWLAALLLVFVARPAVQAQQTMPQGGSTWMPQQPQVTAPAAGTWTSPAMGQGAAAPSAYSTNPALLPAGGEVIESYGRDQTFAGEYLDEASQVHALPRVEDVRIDVPNMLGDFIGVAYFGPPPPSDDNAIRFPEQNATLRGITRFKAADNRSPRPMSRIWYSFNYFENSFGSSVDIARSTFGAELLLLPGFSAEVLFPINDFENGIPGEDSVRYGDLRVVAKGIAFESARALVSWGGALSVPTAVRPKGVPGGVVYFSPFVGYILTSPQSRVFLHGFWQIDIPFDYDDQGLVHTDVGVGYWLMRRIDGPVSGIAPTIELHVYNPVFGRPTGQLRGLIYDDTYNVTLGGTANFLQDRLSIALGLGLPVADRRDYDTEVILHANWRF